MTNPEKFDYYCGVLFARLYDSFPVPVSALEIDEFAVEEGDSDLILHSLNWLEENGLILAKAKIHDLSTSITPTYKGLALLKMLPSSLDKKQSFGEALSEAVKSKTPDTIIDITKSLFLSGIS